MMCRPRVSVTSSGAPVSRALRTSSATDSAVASVSTTISRVVSIADTRASPRWSTTSRYRSSLLGKCRYRTGLLTSALCAMSSIETWWKPSREKSSWATARICARDGFHHVSMDDIANSAEVSKPVLYRHFPSKLDLYLDVVDHRGEALVSAIDTTLETVVDGETDGRSVVRALVRAYVEFVEHAGDSSSLLFE